MNIYTEKEIEVTLIIKEYEFGNNIELFKPIILKKSQQYYYLNKEFFNYFIKQNNLISNDIDFNKVNIEFYDFKNGEFINQDDDTLEGDDQFYRFRPEFLSKDNQMMIQIFINEYPLSYFKKLRKKIDEFKELSEKKNDLLKKLDHLITKQEKIKLDNDNLKKQLKIQEQKSNIDLGNKQ